MHLFDMHADIGTNFINRHKNGESEIFKKCNKDNLTKGEVKGVFMACFFEGKESWPDMQEMVSFTNEEINQNLDCLRQVKTKEDLIVDDKTLALISVEGMCGIKEDVETKIEWLYDHNVKVASLVWNEVNALANGWRNNPLAGLSEKGYQVVKKMNELNMIIDVSHINEKGFWDIISASSKPIIATHSNARALCKHERNLTNQQIKAIGIRGGLIGLNTCRFFIDEDNDKCDSLHLARHARYMADLIGVEHIACGFDYMDFLPGFEGENANDMNNASESQNLIKALFEVGFNEKEVAMIAYENVYNFLKENL